MSLHPSRLCFSLLSLSFFSDCPSLSLCLTLFFWLASGLGKGTLLLLLLLLLLLKVKWKVDRFVLPITTSPGERAISAIASRKSSRARRSSSSSSNGSKQVLWVHGTAGEGSKVSCFSSLSAVWTRFNSDSGRGVFFSAKCPRLWLFNIGLTKKIHSTDSVALRIQWDYLDSDLRGVKA